MVFRDGIQINQTNILLSYSCTDFEGQLPGGFIFSLYAPVIKHRVVSLKVKPAQVAFLIYKHEKTVLTIVK